MAFGGAGRSVFPARSRKGELNGRDFGRRRLVCRGLFLEEFRFPLPLRLFLLLLGDFSLVFGECVVGFGHFFSYSGVCAIHTMDEGECTLLFGIEKRGGSPSRHRKSVPPWRFPKARAVEPDGEWNSVAPSGPPDLASFACLFFNRFSIYS